MAKRSRYREMESLMTKIILGEALVFVLYLVCAGLGSTVLKVITAIIAILGSLLCLGWLIITGEFSRRRSLWMVTGFVSIVLCVLVSLLLGYPGPAPTV
ncbi:MAG: hypothetical protein PUD80_07850 [Firmicutes bacterium]|nr:hypothetical protein [Bacillota bacterium]